MKIGLTLPNRAVLFGAVTVEQLLRLAERITSWDQEAQFACLVGNVLPALEAAA